MFLTKKYLQEFLDCRRISIPASLEKELLEEYGQLVIDDDGKVYEYTEQDICEQLRKRLR